MKGVINMSRNYDVPPDTSEKEKAIGGILTFVQNACQQNRI